MRPVLSAAVLMFLMLLLLAGLGGECAAHPQSGSAAGLAGSVPVIAAPVLQEAWSVASPDGRIGVTVETGSSLTLSVTFDQRLIVAPSSLSLTFADGTVLGPRARVREVATREVHEILTPVVPEKFAAVDDEYREMIVAFRGGFSLEVRAADDGVAWRFRTARRGEVEVTDEAFTVSFTADHPLWFPAEESMLTHQERAYEKLTLSGISPGTFASIPVLVDVGQGVKVAVTESDLRDYPGAYLSGTGGNELRAVFPPYPLEVRQVRDRTVRVEQGADFIARTSGERTWPWRVLAIAGSDADLLTNTLVWRLAPECRIADPSWIRPGQVAWDWWNALNLRGVDFTAGLNTDTYRYYIDFAADHGIEYVILDEGWSRTTDLFAVNPAIDLEALLAHARRRGVGVILWVVWKTLDDQLEDALDAFAEWGVAGIKVDFMQRDDQPMVNWYWRIAEEAAARQLLVDFHGAYKPAGLRRAWPNVLTREGVMGLEHVKWSENPTPEHDVTLPFIRMLAGPMDYTPGAMANANPDQFHAVFNRPMSLGTRCHQLAMYVIFESPLQMLCDSPSRYEREQECLEFITGVPTVWDDTRVLVARVGEVVALARRRGTEWFAGAMTGADARECELDFGFLPAGEYDLEIFADGPNAERNAMDYRRTLRRIGAGEKLAIRLAPGGGWVARITPRE